MQHIDFWQNLEGRVLAVCELALQYLAAKRPLPNQEDKLNRILYICILKAIRELSTQGDEFLAYPMYEANNQPDAEDEERAVRENKRPDFQFGYIDHQELDVHKSAKQFVIECKRLGDSGRSDWELNKNYCFHGIQRFQTENHGYGKGATIGAMIGYLQNMLPDQILEEVNSEIKLQEVPVLELSNEGWKEGDVSRLNHQFDRPVLPTPFKLRHLWVDIRSNPESN